MALPILDGNQSATTLSTILSSGQHITAHTVVSLGTQAVTDISTAVGLLQSAVATQGSVANTTFVKIGGHTGTATTGNIVHVSSVGAMKVDASASTQPISGTVTIGSCVTHGVNVANSVTISSLPAISGTVTANPTFTSSQLQWIKVGNTFCERIGPSEWRGGRVETDQIFITYVDDTVGWRATGGLLSYPPYFGGDADSRIPPEGVWLNPTEESSITVSYEQPSNQKISGTITIGSLPVQLSTTTIGGTARLNVTLSSSTTIGATAPSYGNLYGGSDGTNLRAISVDTSGRTVVTGSVSVASTTVTISALPSGALTTRFGSVVTANTAGITSAVTNTSRKYLLAQNISAGTVTIGIGFSPTTTQGIQLTAGAGLTFDSFVPTGAVYWLGATTGAAYTILEG